MGNMDNLVVGPRNFLLETAMIDTPGAGSKVAQEENCSRKKRQRK